MRVTIIVFFLFKSSFVFCQSNPELILLLDSIKQEDQKWRNIITNYRNNQIDTLDIKTLGELMNKADSLNYISIKKIFDQHGFLGFDKVGKQGSHNFWLIIQHQDKYPDFQTAVLAKMKKEVFNINAKKSDYAYLMDRVMVNTDQLQIYGTQMRVNSDSTSYEPKPTFEPSKLNERRKEMNLRSIEKYIDIMNERYFGTLKSD